MKLAKVKAASYWIDCPHCGEPLASDSGSLNWDANEMVGQEHTCFACKKSSKIPSK